MTTGLTKKFFNASDDSYTQLFAGCDADDTTMRCTNLQPWKVGDKLILTMDRVDASGNPTGKKERIYAEVSTDNYLINIIRALDGDVAQPHATGCIIEDVLSSTHIEALREGLLAEHDEFGLHNEAMIVRMMGRMYPVGSLYFNAGVATNPDTLLGFGTWLAWGSGRVPVGVNPAETEFDTLEETGGTKTSRHGFFSPPINTNAFQDMGTNYLTSVAGDMNTHLNAGGSSSLTRSAVIRNVGGTIGTNGTTGTEVAFYYYTAPTLQPYITTYIWKRTA